MIDAWVHSNGQLVICLKRCNDFGDHKSGGLDGGDGDILFACDLGDVDAADAVKLIKKMRRRLRSVGVNS